MGSLLALGREIVDGSLPGRTTGFGLVMKKESTLRSGHHPLGLTEGRNGQEWFQTDGEPLPRKKPSTLRNHQAAGLVYVPSISKDASTV